jgi:hypothetical protein
MVGEGERRTVAIDVPAATIDEPDDGRHDEPRDAGGDGLHAMQTTGIVVGAVGAGALVVGSIMGGLALGEKGTIDDNCVDHVCNADGKEAADRGQSYAMASTVLLPVGAALIAAGVTLYLVAPADDEGGAERVSFVSLTAAGRDAVALGGGMCW